MPRNPNKPKVYMHTLDGRPAMFDGEQIVTIRSGVKLSAVLVKTLEEIHEQRDKAIRFRGSHGWSSEGYGHIYFNV